MIRHHKTYRKDWFVPDNSCPINTKKLKSQVKVERVLPIAPYVVTKQFDWRQQAPQKPDDLWVGKTIFFLRPIPKVSFDKQVQMIAVEPEGKGRKHAYLPRVFSESYATARSLGQTVRESCRVHGSRVPSSVSLPMRRRRADV